MQGTAEGQASGSELMLAVWKGRSHWRWREMAGVK